MPHNTSTPWSTMRVGLAGALLVVTLLLNVATTHANDRIVWTNEAGQVTTAALDGSAQQVILDGLSAAVGVAFTADGYLFIADDQRNKIARCKPDGSEFSSFFVGPTRSPHHLVVDDLHQKIYWYSYGFFPDLSSDDSVWRANFDGTNIEKFLPLHNSGIFAVDPQHDRFFYLTGSGITIRDLTGAEIGEFTLANPAKIRGIAADTMTQKLYLLSEDGSDSTVRSVNYSGTEAAVVATIPNSNPKVGTLSFQNDTGELLWATLTGVERLVVSSSDYLHLATGLVTSNPAGYNGYVYFGSGNGQVYRQALTPGSMMEISVLPVVNNPKQITYDAVSERLYWVDKGGSIARAAIDGTDRQQFTTISIPNDSFVITGIEVAPSLGSVFVAIDRQNSVEIRSYNVATTALEASWVGSMQSIGGVSVSHSGQVFAALGDGVSQPSIKQGEATLTGAFTAIDGSSVMGNTFKLVVHGTSGQIFHASPYVLERHSLTWTEAQSIAYASPQDAELTGFALAPNARRVYFAHKGDGSPFNPEIASVDLNGEDHQTVLSFGTEAADPRDIAFADRTAPAVPVVTMAPTGITLGDSSGSFGGTAEPYGIVTLYIDGDERSSVVASSDGTWTLQVPNSLSVGVHSASFVQTDLAGNSSVEGAESALTVTAPPTPTTVPTAVATSNPGLPIPIPTSEPTQSPSPTPVTDTSLTLKIRALLNQIKIELKDLARIPDSVRSRKSVARLNKTAKSLRSYSAGLKSLANENLAHPTVGDPKIVLKKARKLERDIESVLKREVRRRRRAIDDLTGQMKILESLLVRK
jgi:hypothetical protein